MAFPPDGEVVPVAVSVERGCDCARSLGGTLCLMIYFYTLPEPVMQVVYWHLLFAAINGWWIVRLATRMRCTA